MFRITSKTAYTIGKFSRHYLWEVIFLEIKWLKVKKLIFGLYNPYKTLYSNPFNNLYYPENII